MMKWGTDVKTVLQMSARARALSQSARRVDVHECVADGEDVDILRVRAARRARISRMTSSWPTVSPRSASPSATRMSSYASGLSSFSWRASHSAAPMKTPAVRPFCVSRRGRPVRRICSTRAESVVRNSLNERTSSDDLKVNMAFLLDRGCANNVQNSASQCLAAFCLFLGLRPVNTERAETRGHGEGGEFTGQQGKWDASGRCFAYGTK